MSVLEWINHKLILLIIKNLRIYCYDCQNLVKVTWYQKKYDYMLICENESNKEHPKGLIGRYRNILGPRDKPYWVDKNG